MFVYYRFFLEDSAFQEKEYFLVRSLARVFLDLTINNEDNKYVKCKHLYMVRFWKLNLPSKFCVKCRNTETALCPALSSNLAVGTLPSYKQPHNLAWHLPYQ